MMQPCGIITLLTDFGQIDGFVGVMKGVMLNIFPKVRFVDISHEIQSGQIAGAAFLLHTSAGYFPTGAVHLVVVDPGVGSERRPIACQTRNHYFVAPDNGVLEFIYRDEIDFTVYHLNKPGFFLPHTSNTFHGRDIFAPVAARLASGMALAQMGKPITNYARLNIAEPILKPNHIMAQVVHMDRFGNLITLISERILDLQEQRPDQFRIQAGTQSIKGIGKTYSSVGPGELVAYIGSSGYLEIAVRGGNAAEQLQASVGMNIEIQW